MLITWLYNIYLTYICVCMIVHTYILPISVLYSSERCSQHFSDFPVVNFHTFCLSFSIQHFYFLSPEQRCKNACRYDWRTIPQTNIFVKRENCKRIGKQIERREKLTRTEISVPANEKQQFHEWKSK